VLITTINQTGKMGFMLLSSLCRFVIKMI